jgi:T-complex protein 1 subunit gamma
MTDLARAFCSNAGIVLTNDGNAILREIDVTHPAAKSMIELSRTQDEETGDGTTSVIILAGEILHLSQQFLEKNIHPTVIVRAYMKALDAALKVIDSISFPIDVTNRDEMMKIVKSSVGTKFTARMGELIPNLALDAVMCVARKNVDGTNDIDIKKYAKVEKIAGGSIDDCKVLRGVMMNKDVVAPGRMKRRIENPRIMLLDCPLEYKKGENQTNVEITKEEDWAVLLKMEEDWIKETCAKIAAFKPDVVVTEKGCSDLACHYLSKAGITALRRVRKTDNNRIARAAGATVVSRVDEIRESDIGTGAGLFIVEKIGDEYFTFIVDCKEPKACTVVLRGASKDILNEIERNLIDAMGVARNVVQDPRLLPGGGAVEMAVSRAIAEEATKIFAPNTPKAKKRERSVLMAIRARS